jgi:hypothetical protein
MVILYIYSTCWHMKLIVYERQHTATARVASAVTVASHARITSSCGVGTSVGPWDRRYRNKSKGVRGNPKEASGTQVNFSFSSN